MFQSLHIFLIIRPKLIPLLWSLQLLKRKSCVHVLNRGPAESPPVGRLSHQNGSQGILKLVCGIQVNGNCRRIPVVLSFLKKDGGSVSVILYQIFKPEEVHSLFSDISKQGGPDPLLMISLPGCNTVQARCSVNIFQGVSK